MAEKIQEGFAVFLHDGEIAFGAVRKVSPKDLVIYVENHGDFNVPVSAVHDVHFGKVLLDSRKLESSLKDAIARAHRSEDPA